MRTNLTIAGAFVAGIVLAVGFVLIYPHLWEDAVAAEPQEVQRIRIELQKYVDAQVEGNRLNVPKRPSLFGTPDYYLEIVIQDEAEPLTTQTYKNTPVGNGLEWLLDVPVALDRIYEVRLYDAGLLRDALVDRVLVASSYEEGQYFNFHLLPDIPSAARRSEP